MLLGGVGREDMRSSGGLQSKRGRMRWKLLGEFGATIDLGLVYRMQGRGTHPILNLRICTQGPYSVPCHCHKGIPCNQPSSDFLVKY